MDFFEPIFFGPNIFLTKTTQMSTTTTTIKMGFDTIENNLVDNIWWNTTLPSTEEENSLIKNHLCFKKFIDGWW